MRAATLPEVMAAMRRSYGSLSEPRFDAVRVDRQRSPLPELRAWLPDAYITEDTDPDTDVSFGFLVRKGPATRLLQLSAVGPFASVRTDRGQDTYLSLGDDLTELDLRLLDYLDHAGRVLVEPDLLATRVPELALFNTDPDLTSVYHGLFSDTGRDPLD